MPASKERKLVVARMYPDMVRKLDRLRLQRTVKVGQSVGRSEMLNVLVDEAARSLPADDSKRSRRVAHAR